MNFTLWYSLCGTDKIYYFADFENNFKGTLVRGDARVLGSRKETLIVIL